jgi:acyl carrier protein
MSQSTATTAVKDTIRAKVADLARQRGLDAAGLRDDEVIPETGLLDSAGIMELLLWYESVFDVEIDDADITLENFGTVERMAAYRDHARG